MNKLDLSTHYTPRNRTERDFRCANLTADIMKFIMSAVADREFESLERLGITKTTILKLNSISSGALHIFAREIAAPFSITLDDKKLSQFLDRVIKDDIRSQLVDRAILLGIRQPALARIIGISRRDFDSRRAILGIPEIPPGRIQHLEERDSELLYRTIEKHVPKNENGVFLLSLEAICTVSEKSGYRIAQIWSETIDSKDVFYAKKFQLALY